MATVYAPPASVGEPPEMPAYHPDGDYLTRWRLHEAGCEAYLQAIQDEARKANKGDLVGEVVRFGMADGHAIYVVWSQRPLSLVHVPIFDAWQIPEAHARGLRVKDIRAAVKRDKFRAKAP